MYILRLKSRSNQYPVGRLVVAVVGIAVAAQDYFLNNNSNERSSSSSSSSSNSKLRFGGENVFHE